MPGQHEVFNNLTFDSTIYRPGGHGNVNTKHHGSQIFPILSVEPKCENPITPPSPYYEQSSCGSYFVADYSYVNLHRTLLEDRFHNVSTQCKIKHDSLRQRRYFLRISFPRKGVNYQQELHGNKILAARKLKVRWSNAGGQVSTSRESH